jgi:hypothetical protein
MSKVKARVLRACVILVLSSALFDCSRERKPVNLVMDVWINQSVEKVAGRPWPHAKDGEPLGMTAVEQPCEVVLHLPSANTLRLKSKQTVLQQERGIVTSVSVLPLDELVDFGTAIVKAEEIARQHGIQERKFYEVISHWRDAPPNRDPFAPKYMARTAVEPGINLYVNLKPSSGEAGWFIALDFQRAAVSPRRLGS